MPRRLLMLLTLLLGLIAGAATTERELLVHFDKDKSVLTPEAIAQLDAFLKECTLSGDFAFTVHGHTDSDGSVAYNDALSAARSAVVMQYLGDHGVPTDAVQVERSGELDPLGSNGDASGMALNRRVRLTFTRNYYADTDELRQALTQGSVQRFTVDAASDMEITGKAGVRLRLPAGSLVDALGRPVTGTVNIELTEALGTLAMIGHNLSTRSGDRMLETGGMLKVSATDANGAELRLSPASAMEVLVPNPQATAGMELFTSTDGADWTTTSKPLQVTTVRQWVEPRRPYVTQRAFKEPIYKEDKKGRPAKPSVPGLRAAPIMPRRESYPAHRTLLSFLNPRRAESQAQARYEAAMERYATQLVRYEKAKVAYEEELATYPERLARYEERKAVWDEQKKAEHTRWVNEVYVPAYAAYTNDGRDLAVLRDSLMADWQDRRMASLEEFVITSDSAGTGDVSALNAYVFTTSKLGWINC
ncbi:MAG TPA: OmpA family protein, partial [Flavobacteriales bacterium]